MNATPSPDPLVMLVVGTDHHPFDRAVRWVDDWAAANGHRARVVIQYGTSRPPAHAQGSDLLPVRELEAMMAEAVAVVCHGGPGTIMAAREAGIVPICIPRRSDLGEHVDDHQVRFSSRLARAGQIHLAATAENLGALLERALAGDDGFTLDLAGADPAAAAAARFGELVARLLMPKRLSEATALDPRVGPGGQNDALLSHWPSVSAVVATHGQPDLVRRAIRSVLSQAYAGAIECVVVFDQVLPFDLGDEAPPEGRHRNLRVMSNDRSSGFAGARRAGADRAFGELVMFCDDADEWLPGKVAGQVAALVSTGADVAVTGVRTARHRRVRRPGRLTGSDVHPSSMAVRREALQTSARSPDRGHPVPEDAGWLRDVVEAAKIAELRRPFVRVHRTGRTSPSRWTTITDAIGSSRAARPSLLDAPSPPG